MAFKLGDGFVDLTLHSSKFQKGLSRVQKTMGKAMSSVKGKIEAFGRVATRTFKRFAIAATAAATAATYAFVKFDDAMREVWTLVDISRPQWKKLKGQVLDLSVTVGKSAKDLARSLYLTISAGFTNAADSTRILDVASKAAIAGVADVAVAVDGITSALNSYGESSRAAAKYADIMFTTVRLGKTELQYIAPTLAMATPMAAQLGVSFEELSAAVAVLTKVGTPTSRTFMGLRQVMASILKPTTQAIARAKQLGLEFNATNLRAKGLVGLLTEVKEKVKGSDEALADLFGNIRSLTPVMALTGKLFDEFTAAMEEMGNSAGAVNKAYAKMASGLGRQLARLWAIAKKLTIEFGERLAPTIRKVVDGLIALYEWMAGKVLLPAWVERMASIIRRQLGPLPAFFSDIFTRFSTAVEKFKDKWWEYWVPIQNFILTLPTRLKIAYYRIKGTLENLWTNIKHLWDNLKPFASWIKNNFVIAFENAFKVIQVMADNLIHNLGIKFKYDLTRVLFGGAMRDEYRETLEREFKKRGRPVVGGGLYPHVPKELLEMPAKDISHLLRPLMQGIKDIAFKEHKGLPKEIAFPPKQERYQKEIAGYLKVITDIERDIAKVFEKGPYDSLRRIDPFDYQFPAGKGAGKGAAGDGAPSGAGGAYKPQFVGLEDMWRRLAKGSMGARSVEQKQAELQQQQLGEQKKANEVAKKMEHRLDQIKDGLSLWEEHSGPQMTVVW